MAFYYWLFCQSLKKIYCVRDVSNTVGIYILYWKLIDSHSMDVVFLWVLYFQKEEFQVCTQKFEILSLHSNTRRSFEMTRLSFHICSESFEASSQNLTQFYSQTYFPGLVTLHASVLCLSKITHSTPCAHNSAFSCQKPASKYMIDSRFACRIKFSGGNSDQVQDGYNENRLLK